MPRVGIKVMIWKILQNQNERPAKDMFVVVLSEEVWV